MLNLDVARSFASRRFLPTLLLFFRDFPRTSLNHVRPISDLSILKGALPVLDLRSDLLSHIISEFHLVLDMADLCFFCTPLSCPSAPLRSC